MKLALVRRHFSTTGGAELYLQRLLEALAGAGHEVGLFTDHWEDAPKGVRVVEIPLAGSRAEKPLRFYMRGNVHVSRT